MSEVCFIDLCNKPRSSLQKQHAVRAPITVEKQVAVFLHYIMDERLVRKVANAFGIAKSTCSIIVRTVSRAICRIMSDLIKLPTSEAEVKELF